MIKNKVLFTLNNGVEIPAIGLGVFQSSPEDTVEAVKVAINNGYRLIDTAAVYMNEEQVGEAIKATGIKREDIFVTTKLWLDDFGYDSALKGIETSLKKLQMDYADLYLIHWPIPAKFDITLESYRAMEKMLADGLVRAIGVSNFKEKHLETLMDRFEVVPALNQVELHPFLAQKGLLDFHKKHGILTQAWSPIGGSKRYWAKDPNAIQDPLKLPYIVELGEKYGKSPAQIILRWHIQNGVSAIPKSVHENRIKENFDVFDFELSADEIAGIDALDTGERGGPDPDEMNGAPPKD